MLVDEQGDLVWLYRDEQVVVWFSLKKKGITSLEFTRVSFKNKLEDYT